LTRNLTALFIVACTPALIVYDAGKPEQVLDYAKERAQ